jgi:hypothetical protein
MTSKVVIAGDSAALGNVTCPADHLGLGMA